MAMGEGERGRLESDGGSSTTRVGEARAPISLVEAGAESLCPGEGARDVGSAAVSGALLPSPLSISSKCHRNLTRA